jgi:hypothetical protein
VSLLTTLWDISRILSGKNVDPISKITRAKKMAGGMAQVVEYLLSLPPKKKKKKKW